MNAYTDDIPCFDYTKPPPLSTLKMNARGTGARLRDEWQRWKAAHDPPAMWSGFNLNQLTGWAWLRFGIKHESLGYTELPTNKHSPYSKWQEQARKLAWSWYDRRAKLARVLKYKGVKRTQLWPALLLFGDEQVQECERWQGQDAPAEEFPACLHELGEFQNLLEPQTEQVFPIAPESFRERWASINRCRILGHGDEVFYIHSEGRTSRSIGVYPDVPMATLRRVPYAKLLPVKKSQRRSHG